MADTVLVTGASGFVGAAVARAALARGFKVKVLMRPTANRANIAGLELFVVDDTLMQWDRGLDAHDHELIQQLLRRVQ